MADIMERIKMNMGKNSLLMAAIAISVITLIIYIIYGTVCKYFDVGVFFIMLVACAGYAAAFALGLFTSGQLFETLALVATIIGNIFMAWGLGFFFLNSFPVWADELNGITMYNSRGGLFPVISIMLLFIATEVVGIIVTFKDKKAKEA